MKNAEVCELTASTIHSTFIIRCSLFDIFLAPSPSVRFRTEPKSLGFYKEINYLKPGSIKNIIFDLDGTLVDSKRDIAAAQHWVLCQLGVHSYTPEELYPLIGKPLAETFAALLPVELHHRIPEATEMYKNHYPPRALETTTLFPGVKETLETLRARGVRLATATTKLSAGSLRVLTHFGVAKHFAQIQGSDYIPFKPDPFIIAKILDDQSWERDETLMVGDTDNDILAGKRAGIPTCGVTYGLLSKLQIQELNPDIVVDSLRDLLLLI